MRQKMKCGAFSARLSRVFQISSHPAPGVTFRWKDYRAGGRDRQKVMTLATAEFIRRFLIHVLPQRLPPYPP
jgi:Putative transposase